jgi:hypothetical protein
MKGARYMFIGYIIGTLVSTFTFGQPYLLEDWIRAKFRKLTTTAFLDRGFNVIHFDYDLSQQSIVPPYTTNEDEFKE